MPKKSTKPGERMTWEGDRKRWKKVYAGKTFHFAAPSKSDRPAERAAWEAFEKWRAVIDADRDKNKPHREEYERATAVRLGVVRWIGDELSALDQTGEVSPSEEERHPDSEEWRAYLTSWRDRLAKELTALEREFAKVAPRPLDRPDTVFEWPFIGCTDAEEKAWLRRVDMLADFRRLHGEKTVPDDRTVRAAVRRHLDRKRAEGCKPSTLKRLEERLAEVVRFGGDGDVAAINAGWLERYREHLLAEVQSGRYSRENAKATLNVARTFVRGVYRAEELNALPRNIDDLAIKTERKSPETYPPHLLKELAGQAPAPLRCWLLLIGNTGMLPADLSDLKIDEADLELGTITRKRSKTADHGNVPTVTWLLWDETLEALRQQAEDRPDPAPGCEDLMLLVRNGGRLKYYAAGKGKNDTVTVDNVRNALTRLRKKMAGSGINVPTRVDLWRKTGASVINSQKDSAGLVQLFLGHSPATVADKHYAAAPLGRLADATVRLGEVYGFATDPGRLTNAKAALG